MIPYFLAVSNVNLGKQQEAEKQFAEAIEKGPLNEKAYLGLAGIYNSKGDASKAYDVLLEGTRINPRSAEVLKAYALQTLKLNLTSYGDESVKTLKELMSPAEFEAFRKQYEKERAAAEAQFMQY
jgi:tetratricopeptide (TPR) repeat protein